MAAKLTLHRRDDTGVSTVALIGELDVSRVQETERVLLDALKGRPVLVIDLSELQLIDSSGMHMLVQIHARCEERGARMVLVPGPPRVRRVFAILGLAERFDFLDASHAVPQDG